MLVYFVYFEWLIMALLAAVFLGTHLLVLVAIWSGLILLALIVAPFSVYRQKKLTKERPVMAETPRLSKQEWVEKHCLMLSVVNGGLLLLLVGLILYV